MFNAGDHVPVIPFVEVVGKAANVAPEQIGETEANVGVRPKPLTTVGVKRFVVVPSPKRPSILYPHAFKELSVLNPNEC